MIPDHRTIGKDEEFWRLGYVGSGSVTRTFKTTSNARKSAAIVVRCSCFAGYCPSCGGTGWR